MLRHKYNHINIAEFEALEDKVLALEKKLKSALEMPYGKPWKFSTIYPWGALSAKLVYSQVSVIEVVKLIIEKMNLKIGKECAVPEVPAKFVLQKKVKK